MSSTPLLSLAVWVPVLAGLLVLIAGRTCRAPLVRILALSGAVAGFAVTVPLWLGFDPAVTGMQFVEIRDWIPRFNINYRLGVDGIALPFLLLNSFITIIVVLGGLQTIRDKVAEYNAAFLIMSGLMNGIFCALDGVLFYVFFESSLIPLYLIIGIWGGNNRVYAALKFFLFTLAGSLFLLIALLYLFIHSGYSFDLLDWHRLPLAFDAQIWIFLAFLVAFAVKVPMWPLHIWLPDAHTEAPTGGSVVLAAIALKLGAYGFLRFSLPIVPDASHALSGFLIILSLIAVIYVGLVALVQTDMKKLVAYSSVAHMGLVTLGFFLFSPLGVEGALVQMVSHGFVSAALFLCIGVLYDRMHCRQIASYGGVAKSMPKFAAFFMLFALANVGLPATSGFVGEFMVILAAVKHNFWVAVAAASSLVLSAAYTLWMFKRVVFGPVIRPEVTRLRDVSSREFFILAVLVLCVLVLGVYPQPLTGMMHASVTDLLHHVDISKIP